MSSPSLNREAAPMERQSRDEGESTRGAARDSPSDKTEVDNDSNEERTSSSSPSLSDEDEKVSLVEYFGPNSGYCGYCKRNMDQSGGGKQTYDMNSYRLTPSDYQELLDRGWRRSGSFCYNPINQTTCCPNYPIVCKAFEFMLSRSQRKCLEALNSYLLTGDTKSGTILKYFPDEAPCESTGIESTQQKSFDLLKTSSKARDRRFVRTCEKKVRLHGMSLDEAIESVKVKWLKKRQNTAAQLEDYLYPRASASGNMDQSSIKPKHKLVIDLFHVKSQRSMDLREAEHSVMIEYQKKVHNETQREWTMTRFCDFLVDSPIIVEPLSNYDYLNTGSDQIQDIDYDKLTVDVNQDFLSHYLLTRPTQLPTAYGTYHCYYHLDGSLIAVGVLDVLPKCITTVYFFYDPSYAFLNLGTYSAMVEISMVRQMDRHFTGHSLANQLTDYHLGFYVHECKKMHYKTKFRPSYLLCSKTYRYVRTDICLKKLEGKKYSDFADGDATNSSREISQPFKLVDLLQIRVRSPVSSKDLNLREYLSWLATNLGPEYAELIVNGYLVTYAQLVGPSLLKKLCLRIALVHRSLLERYKRLKTAKSRAKIPNNEATSK